MTDIKYFADKAKLEDLLNKISVYTENLVNLGIDKRMKRSFSQYYGQGQNENSSFLTSGGDQGELSKLSVNTYRSLLRYQLALITADRPAFKVVPTNTDFDSMASAVVGEDVLEYYMKVKNLERVLTDAVEKALYGGEGFVALQWDSEGGELYGVDPDTDEAVAEGDIKFSTYHTGEVIRDISQEEPQWYILKDVVNKFELAARFPELKDEIISLDYKIDKLDLINKQNIVEDSCALYTFYHARTPALPEGKMVIFTDTEKLLDIPLPYPVVPVYRVAPANIAGTGLGYSQGFDILAMQEAKDDLYSAVVTNNINFATQCILIPRSADINYRDLVEGMSAIEYDADMGEIKALQLTQSSPETYNLMDRLDGEMEKLTGINEVIRGDPSANLRSGNALALVAAQAVKYNSTLEQQYSRLIEDVGSATLAFLQEFAETPRFIAVVGKENRFALKSFSKDDLLGVARVSVEMTSALSKTQAGRIQIAENLLQQNMLKRPEQYIAVLETGKLDPIMESERTELLNIKSENEQMREGKAPLTIMTDNHALHIREHRSVLDDPSARQNPEVVQATLAHIAEHESLWNQVGMRPAILAATGQMPPPMPQMPQQGGTPGVTEDKAAADNQPNQPGIPNVPPNADPADQAAFAKLNLQ